MRSFNHHSAQSLEEVCSLLTRYQGRARLNAGGTDLISFLKGDVLPDYPEALINLKTVPGLKSIDESANEVRIGSLTTLNDIAKSDILIQRYPLLAQAANTVAGPQIRNVATLGGNLCQETRCWYYRYPSNIGGPVQCLRKGSGRCLALKGDNRYHAIFGGKKCFSVNPSDMAVALTALDAKLSIMGSGGQRILHLADFYHPLGTKLENGEFIREIIVPSRKSRDYQTFKKFTLRKPIDFAVVSVAVVMTMREQKCIEERIVLGGVAPAPVRSVKAENTVHGHPISSEIAIQAATAALRNAKPLKKNGYKIEIAKSLIEDAIMGCSKVN